jgi:hypothetical protein
MWGVGGRLPHRRAARERVVGQAPGTVHADTQGQSFPVFGLAHLLGIDLSDPQLREQIIRATNKAEAYNGYTKWLHFGGDGYLRSRDPELQEKAVKFLDLMANSIIFSTTVDMTDTLRQMAAQGREVNPDDIAALSPHRRDNVLRFGDYDTATLHIPPGPYDSTLRLRAKVL